MNLVASGEKVRRGWGCEGCQRAGQRTLDRRYDDDLGVASRRTRRSIGQCTVTGIVADLIAANRRLLEATQRRLESQVRTEFHYADQEVLLRHLHHVVAEEVEDYKRELEGK